MATANRKKAMGKGTRHGAATTPNTCRPLVLRLLA